MGVKRSRISISSCSLGCLPNHQFPLQMSLGRLGGESAGLIPARQKQQVARKNTFQEARKDLDSAPGAGFPPSPRFIQIFFMTLSKDFCSQTIQLNSLNDGCCKCVTFLLKNVGYYRNILTGLNGVYLPVLTLCSILGVMLEGKFQL